MRAKEYLRRIKNLTTKIEQLKLELRELEDAAIGISGVDYSKELIQSSSSGEPAFVKLMPKISDLKIQIANTIEEYVVLRHKIINQIHQLENDVYIQVLFKTYAENKSLEIVADELHYSYGYTRHLHQAALIEFEKIFANDLK